MTNDNAPVRPLRLKIEPATRSDQTNLVEASKQLALEDPGFGIEIDPESGEIILSGTDELHLDLKIHRLIHEFGVEANVGQPQVAYRESLAQPADIDYTHKKQTGGAGQFARVKLKLEPNEPGKGNEFESSIIGGTVPKAYVPGVEKGVKSVWDNGMLIGFPMVDMKVTLYDGAFHDVDLSAIAFEIATRAAMKEGCEKAGVVILEPIMAVVVSHPPECVGQILGDLNGRRCRIIGQEFSGGEAVVTGYVPLAQMFGYVSSLRKLTSGRGRHTMRFDHFAPVPHDISGGPDDFPPAVGMRA